MHSYQDRHGRLPPAVVYGHDGQALHSWRVLILPYIEEDTLFKEFHLDEPWDSPHNLALLPRMPATYAPPRNKRSKVPAYHTVCHVFVGPGTAFEEGMGLRMPENFPKGLTNTLLVVEAGEPVPWTKPDDLVYDPSGPLPDLRCLFKDGFRAGLATGERRFVGKDTSEAVLRWVISRDTEGRRPADW